MHWLSSDLVWRAERALRTQLCNAHFVWNSFSLLHSTLSTLFPVMSTTWLKANKTELAGNTTNWWKQNLKAHHPQSTIPEKDTLNPDVIFQRDKTKINTQDREKRTNMNIHLKSICSRFPSYKTHDVAQTATSDPTHPKV